MQKYIVLDTLVMGVERKHLLLDAASIIRYIRPSHDMHLYLYIFLHVSLTRTLSMSGRVFTDTVSCNPNATTC